MYTVTSTQPPQHPSFRQLTHNFFMKTSFCLALYFPEEGAFSLPRIQEALPGLDLDFLNFKSQSPLPSSLPPPFYIPHREKRKKLVVVDEIYEIYSRAVDDIYVAESG